MCMMPVFIWIKHDIKWSSQHSTVAFPSISTLKGFSVSELLQIGITALATFLSVPIEWCWIGNSWSRVQPIHLYHQAMALCIVHQRSNKRVILHTLIIPFISQVPSLWFTVRISCERYCAGTVKQYFLQLPMQYRTIGARRDLHGRIVFWVPAREGILFCVTAKIVNGVDTAAQ